MFVEVSADGGATWTTLPDANNHTTQNTGQSCWDGDGLGDAARAHARVPDAEGRLLHAHRDDR